MRSAGLTHTGMVRKENQDAFINKHEPNGMFVLAVADGMGGHKAGDVASACTVRELDSYFSIWGKGDYFKKTAEIKNLIKHINRNLYYMSNQSPDYDGMGTTLTLLIANGKKAHIFHVGDSRAYLIDKNITQITKDHSLVQFMLDSGQISKEEAADHPNKNVITRAMGTDEDIEVDIYEIALSQGDRILLCSDGLTDELADDDLKNAVKEEKSLRKAVFRLVEMANAKGGHDNVTALLFEC